MLKCLGIVKLHVIQWPMDAINFERGGATKTNSGLLEINFETPKLALVQRGRQGLDPSSRQLLQISFDEHFGNALLRGLGIRREV